MTSMISSVLATSAIRNFSEKNYKRGCIQLAAGAYLVIQDPAELVEMLGTSLAAGLMTTAAEAIIKNGSCWAVPKFLIGVWAGTTTTLFSYPTDPISGLHIVFGRASLAGSIPLLWQKISHNKNEEDLPFENIV